MHCTYQLVMSLYFVYTRIQESESQELGSKDYERLGNEFKM